MISKYQIIQYILKKTSNLLYVYLIKLNFIELNLKSFSSLYLLQIAIKIANQ